jgi:ParB-like chromosome segregation protein Spo0J
LKSIIVNCKCDDFVDIDKIESIQGELKNISKESMKKLKNSIKTYGFSFPVFIWHNRGHYYSIDGIHRCMALRELSDIDGYDIPKKIPVVFIEAKCKKIAKELLLAASSQYSILNKEYLLSEFISDLDFENIKNNIEVHGVDIDAIISSSVFDEDDSVEKSSIDRNECPKCGYKWQSSK